MSKFLPAISIWFVLGWAILPDTMVAQINPEAQARQELERRNIDEDELRSRLMSKGIDVDNLSNLSADEAMQVQQTIEATMAEMEREKKPIKSENKTFKDTIERPPSKTPEDEENQALEEIDSIRGQEEKKDIPGEIYGQHLFRDQSLRIYNQSKDIKPTDEYLVGVGDVLVVSIWGLSQKQESLEVNADGYVLPNRMPRIYVKGFSLRQVKEILKEKYRQYYRFRTDQFDVTIQFSRVIEVNIFGEVFNYGGFTLPAVNTAFNALVAAGGPTDIGSVRKIKVIRGRSVRVLDVYEFMSDPGAKTDYYLQDNDIIQVPVADFVVDIQGEVNRPFRYELVRGEGLMEAIGYAGGLKENALKSRIKILRYTDDQQVLIDVDYGQLELDKENRALQNGDIIIIDAIKVSQRNTVEVTGAVDYPGTYEITRNNQLSFLLEKIGLNRQSRKDIAFVKKKNADNTISFDQVNLADVINGREDYVLSADDELVVFALSEFTESPTFVVQGAVRQPDTFQYNYTRKIKVSEAITLAGGLKPEAESYLYISREDSLNKNQYQYIRVDLDQVINDPNSQENVEVFPNDILTIGSTRFDTEERFIDVAGAVKQPGRYEFGNDMTIHDALALAGGLTFNAASNRVDIFRVLIEQNQPTRTVVATIEVDRFLGTIQDTAGVKLAPYDQIFVREVPEFEFQKNVTVEGEVIYPGVYSLTGDNEKIASIIQRAGGLTQEAFEGGATVFRALDSIGYVVVDLEDALSRPRSNNNILLKEGDIIAIPKQQDLVRIIGYTNASELYPDRILSQENGIAVPFNPGKNARYYVDEFAAGVSEEGDICELTVEHANGQIEKVTNFGLFKTYPKVKKGSIIRVGKKKEKKRNRTADGEKEEVDWGKVFANSVAQATTILSLILLLQRID